MPDIHDELSDLRSQVAHMENNLAALSRDLAEVNGFHEADEAQLNLVSKALGVAAGSQSYRYQVPKIKALRAHLDALSNLAERQSVERFLSEDREDFLLVMLTSLMEMISKMQSDAPEALHKLSDEIAAQLKGQGYVESSR